MSSDRRIQTICLIILSTVAIGVALYWLSPVLIPFVLAVFLTYALMPVVDLQIRYLHIPRLVAVVFTIVFGCTILALLSLLISTTITQMNANATEYERQLSALIDRIDERLPLERFHIKLRGLSGSKSDDSLTTRPEDLAPMKFRDSPTSVAVTPTATWADDSDTTKTVDWANTLFQIPQAAIAGFLSNTFGGIMNVLSQGILVLIFMIFLLLGKHAGEIPEGGILSEVQYRIKRYIITLVFISALTGVLVGLTLEIIGVDYALMFGFFAFLLNFIPNIGSIVATLLPIPVVLLSPDLSFTAKVLAVGIPGTIQFIVGYIMAPKVMGQSLDLHPVVVLMALIFFGMIWGVVGMFLATPITAVTRILLEKVELTRPVAELLAGRLSALYPEPDEAERS